MTFEHICVIGQGYIGLPTAAIMASHGFKVTGVDRNPDIVATLKEGRVHIVEPDLEGLVYKVVQEGALSESTKPVTADAFIITVPTPLNKQNQPDMSHVEAAGASIAPLLQSGNLVVLESTSPVGSTARLSKQLANLRPDLSFPHQAAEKADIHLVYCPERVLPSRILTELVQNDRIIGGMTERCSELGVQLYQRFVRGACKQTTSDVAELVKLTENAFRDVNIAFANELSIICDRLALNVWEVIDLANCHPRVDILRPGPGVGGHCIAVDPWFIVDSAPEEAKMIHLARTINDGKRDHVVDRVKSLATSFEKPVIACLGLAFKPDVDDLRESPAIYITEQLAKADIGTVLAVEPHIATLPESLSSHGVELCDALSAIDRADIVVALVNHRHFQLLNAGKVAEKRLVDACGMWPRRRRGDQEPPSLRHVA